MPSRRAYLASLPGLVAGTAGCVDQSGQAGGDDEPNNTESRPDITVEAAAVQYAYRHVSNVDWNDITVADGQFVFVTVDARDASEASLVDEFQLFVGEQEYPPKSFENWPPHDPDVPGERYDPSQEHSPTRRGWLCFPTPETLSEQPSLQLTTDDGRWRWPLDAPKATSPPPAWEWTVETPETVAPGDLFDIEIAAENVGDGPGVFRGAVNFSFPMYMPEGFDIPLAAGESGTGTVEATAEGAQSGTPLVYDIRTPAGDTEVQVEVEETTTTDSETATESE